MKRMALLAAFVIASLAQAPAQVSVEVTLDQDQFLPGEAIVAAVRISNRSGQPLQFGVEEDWLMFSVESREGQIVPKLGDAPVKGEFMLDSSKRATKRVDIGPSFTFSQSGRYSLVATVKLKQWEKEISSLPKNFNIIEGAKLWEQEFGVPGSGGPAGGAPETRRYVVQQANYLKGKLRLYVRVTDGSGGKVFRTVAVGTALSFSQPDPRLDKACNLHLLYQNWAHSFSYTIFNPDGEMILRQTYDLEQTRPRFDVDREGRISVVGGVRRVAANDIPERSTPPPSRSPAPETK